MSLGNIGQAKVEIVAELDALQRGLTKARGIVDKELKKTETRASAFRSRFSGITGAANAGLLRLGATAASVAGPAALGLLFKNALNTGEQLVRLSDKLDITVEGLQKLQFAASQNNVEASSLETALSQLSRRLGELREGGGPLLAQLKETNPELARQLFTAQSLDEAFLLLSDAIAKQTDQTARAALSMSAFGKSGQEVLPVAQLGSQRIKELGDRAEELGLVMSDQLARDADAAADALDVVAKIVSVNLTKGLLGATGEAKSFAEQLTSPEFAEGVRKIGEDLGKFAADLFKIGAAASHAIGQVENFLNRTLAGVQAAGKGVRRVLLDLAVPGAGRADAARIAAGQGGNEFFGPPRPPTGAPTPSKTTTSPTQTTKAFEDALAGRTGKSIEDQKKEAQEFLTDLEDQRREAEGRVIEQIEVERDRRLAALEDMKLSEEEALRARVAIHQIANKEIADSNAETAEAIKAQQEELAQKLGTVLEPFIESLVEGNFTWKGFVSNMIQELAKSGLQQILQTTFGMISGQGFAQASGGTAAAGALAGAAGGGAGGWVGAGLSILSAFLQHGGPFGAGDTIMVGETGPEMLQMGSPGRVSPRDVAMGGRREAKVTMNINGVRDADSFRRSEGQILSRMSKGIRNAETRFG